MSERATSVSERDGKQDLSVTALYTAGTWAWAGLPGAELFAHDGTRNVFAITNAALGLGNIVRRRPSSLRHTLVQRHVMIDRLVEDAAAAHVLELAAGLSRRGAHVSADPAIAYTEVDLPHVIARKRALLETTPAGRAVLARPNLRLVEGDLASLDLASLGAAPATSPLTIVAEGLLMYLDAAAQQSLFRRVRAALPAGGLFVFDLVPMGEQPPPGTSGQILRWLMRRTTGGADFVRDTRTRVEVAADLRAAGFEVAMLEPAAAPARWGVPHLDQTTQQLVFAAWAPSGDRTFVRADAIAASRPSLHPSVHPGSGGS